MEGEVVVRAEFNDDGSLDELVTDGSAHLEMLSETMAYLRMGPIRLTVFVNNGNLVVTMLDEDEDEYQQP